MQLLLEWGKGKGIKGSKKLLSAFSFISLAFCSVPLETIEYIKKSSFNDLIGFFHHLVS